MNRSRCWSTILVLCAWGVAGTVSVAFADEAKEGITTGYKDGFFLETADGNHRLFLQGLLQTRFTYLANQSATDSTTFAVHKGELRLKGHFYRPTLKYGLQIGVATRNAATTAAVCANAGCTTTVNAVTGETTTGLVALDDYFLDWSPIAAIGIKAGQFKVPFLAQELVPQDQVQMVDRSLAHGVFTFGRDLGVSLYGRLVHDHLRYNFFVMNGDGVNTLNRDTSYLAGARIDLPLLGDHGYGEGDVGYSEHPQLSAGVAYVLNRAGAATQGGSVAAGVRASSATADLYFKQKGVSFHGAGIFGRSHTGAAITNWGWHAQAGYCVIPRHLELVARWSGVVFTGATPNQYEYAGGVNYYVKGHRLKLVSDYALLRNVRGQGLTDHRIRTQAQVVF